MNIQVWYQSKSGNTRMVAEAIAQAVGGNASDVASGSPVQCDLLLVGGAIYAGGISGKLKRFLKKLPVEQKVALFSTAAGEGHIAGKVKKVLPEGVILLDGEFHATSANLKTRESEVLDAAAAWARERAGK